MGIINQCLATAIVSYVFLVIGLMFAWPSSTLNLFKSENTTLHRPMRSIELALLGSLSSIGALISIPILGYLMDRIGRKACSIVAPVTHVFAWSLVAVCNRVEVVLFAIFLSGAGGSIFLVLPVYISELCHESIRGTMTSIAMINYIVGFLISYCLGGTVEYKMMIYICLSMTAIGAASVMFLKESPVYLMKRGLEQEAANSIAFYRDSKPHSKEVIQEINALKRAFNPSLELKELSTSPEEENLKPTGKAEKLTLWRFVQKSQSTRREIILTITLVTASIFQGMIVLQVYAEPLFEEAVPNMSPTLTSVLLSVVMIISGLSAAYLIDAAGRRPLMIYSSIAAGLCCVVLGLQLHLHWAPHWVTALFIHCFCAANTIGAGTVPYVLVAEIFLPEVKSFMSMFVIEWGWLCNFTVLFIFNPLVAIVGLGPVFYLFAVVCFLSAVISAVYQPETRGMPVDVIQTAFLERR